MVLSRVVPRSLLKGLTPDSRILSTSVILLVLLINLFAVAFTIAPVMGATPLTSFPELGDENVALDLNTSYWDSARGGPHNLDILELDKDGHRYWGYYGTADHASVGLAFSENLENWTRYSIDNPLVDGFGWPTVGVQNGMIHMFYIHGGILNGVYRATSPLSDGYTFTEQELAAGGNAQHDPFLWYNPVDGDWWLLTAQAGNTIGACHAQNLEDLKSAPNIILRTETDGSWGVLAAPGIFYRNNTYFLTTESYPGGVWVTRAFYSSELGPNCFDGDRECSNSPILLDDDACGFPHLENDQIYYYYSHRVGPGWDWDLKIRKSIPTPPPPPPPPPPQADWYYQSWTKRKPIAINNTMNSNTIGTWSDKTTMPGPRADASSAVMNGKLYVFGGYGPGFVSDVRTETYLYDPTSDGWTQKASMPSNHSYAAVACSIGPKAYIFGGIDNSNNWDGYKTLYIYDTLTDSWSVGADVPVTTGMHSASAIEYNGKIYLMGGWRNGDTSGDVTVYDPATDTYDISKASMPTPRRFFSLSEVDGILYAIGGGGPAGSYLTTNEAYDVAHDSWTTKNSMPFGRWGLARENAAISGKIYISHGMTSVFFATACVYDPASDAWQLLPSANYPRDGHNCGVINGKLYVVAGRDGSGALPYNEQFDPTATTTTHDLYDYQVRIDVDYDLSMKTDFSDLRFTDSDGTTLISYWVQTYTASTSAIAWVKVPTIPASSTKWIWMYYGNPVANSISNGETTFELFDDFNILNASKWSANGSPRVENGALICDYTSKVTSLSSFGTGHALETEAYIGSETSSNHWLGFCASDMDGPFAIFEMDSGGFKAYSYPGTQSTTLNPNYLDAYHWYTITFVTGKENIYIDDSLKAAHMQSLGPMPVEFRVYSGAANIKSQWVAVRKYSLPEPTITIGEEQAHETRLYIDPSLVERSSGDVGTAFQVNVTVRNVQDLCGFDLNVTWDRTMLTSSNCYYQDKLDAMWGSGKWFLVKNESGLGWYKFVAMSTANSFNTTQNQTLFALEFRIEDPSQLKETSIHFAVHKLSDSQGNPTMHSAEDGTYRFIKTPRLEMNPTSKTCHIYGETFHIAISVSDITNATDFEFEIHYNATLLDVVGIDWNAWGTGTFTADEVNGILTGYAAGSPISGNATLLTMTFNATYHHLWKDEGTISGWKNNQTGTIYFQWANLSYASGPDLRYERGGLNQIDIGPDFAYTFSPIQGDTDNNGIVDIFDIRTVAVFYDTVNPEYNLIGDPIVDIFDVVVVGSNFGYAYIP